MIFLPMVGRHWSILMITAVLTRTLFAIKTFCNRMFMGWVVDEDAMLHNGVR